MRRPAKTSDPEEMRDELPSESWRGPRGQILSWRDPISLSLSPADKGALARAIDKAIRSYLDEARSGSLEDRVSFLARLLRVQDQIRGGGDPLVIARIDLPAVHGALHAAAGPRERAPPARDRHVRRVRAPAGSHSRARAACGVGPRRRPHGGSPRSPPVRSASVAQPQSLSLRRSASARPRESGAPEDPDRAPELPVALVEQPGPRSELHPLPAPAAPLESEVRPVQLVEQMRPPDLLERGPGRAGDRGVRLHRVASRQVIMAM